MSASPTASLSLKRTSVGIGHLVVSRDPLEVLVAYGLGSCVGVTAYDRDTGAAGLAHILLAASDGRVPDPKEPARYADTGIEALLAQLAALGATKGRLSIKVAGGASVLGPANAEKFKIGERNADAIREQLKRHGLRASAEDLGGVKGRTLELFVAGGTTLVRTASTPGKEL